jgi:hypothetical protein
MLVEAITLLLLLAIVLELGWIILKDEKIRALSQEKLIAAQEALTKAQERWIEITQKLADALPTTLNANALTPSNDRTPSVQSDDYVAELLATLEALSTSISGLRTPVTLESDELNERIATFTERFEQAVSKLYKSVGEAVAQLIKERQNFHDALAGQSKAQQDELRTLTKALMEALKHAPRAVSEEPSSRALVRASASDLTAEEEAALATLSLRASPPPPEIAPRAIEAAALPQALEDRAPVVSADSSSSPVGTTARVSSSAQTAPLSTLPAESAQGSSEFAKLRGWVVDNLEQIMNRSLNQWSKPEELLRNAPAEIRYTAYMLDPDSKLVLVGCEDSSQRVALALPGGYMDTRYYDWFSLPKGIGARVAQTVIPAIVEANDTGFRVLQRGMITQD